MSTDSSGPASTPSGEQELHRLQKRLDRLESAMAVLRRRADDRSHRAEPLPAPLRAAIADFGRELAKVNAELRVLAPTPRKPSRKAW